MAADEVRDKKQHWKGTSATLAFKRHNGESTLLKAFHLTQPLSVRLCPLILAYDSFSFSLKNSVCFFATCVVVFSKQERALSNHHIEKSSLHY